MGSKRIFYLSYLSLFLGNILFLNMYIFYRSLCFALDAAFKWAGGIACV